MLDKIGLIGPPCGDPSYVRVTTPPTMKPAFSHLPIRRRMSGSAIRCATIFCSHSCWMWLKYPRMSASNKCPTFFEVEVSTDVSLEQVSNLLRDDDPAERP